MVVTGCDFDVICLISVIFNGVSSLNIVADLKNLELKATRYMEFIIFTLTAVLVKVRNSMATCCWGSYKRIFSYRFKGVYSVSYKRK